MRLRRPSAAGIARLLAEARSASPTYPEVGATRGAYGTLPGHPERGEVRFAVERDEDGSVAFRIVSFSRTVDPLARLGSPVTRRIQQRVTERYLDAIAAAAGAGRS